MRRVDSRSQGGSLKSCKMWFLILLILVWVSPYAYGDAVDFSIAGRDAKAIQGTLYLTRDDLLFGEVLIEGERREVDRVELSLDGGKRWRLLVEGGWNFAYGFRPQDGRYYEIVLRGIIRGDPVFTTDTYKIHYQDTTDRILLKTLLDDLKRYYEKEEIEGFLSCFSKGYRDLESLKRYLKRDFEGHQNIRLSWEVLDEEIQLDAARLKVNYKREWERKGRKIGRSAKVLLLLQKERGWRITGVVDDGRVFLTGTPDLAIRDSDITYSTEPIWGETITLEARVRNTGTGEAWEVCVRFYDNDGKVGEDHHLDVIEPDGVGEVSVEWVVDVPSPHTIRVVVDEEAKIDEENEENNQAEKILHVALPDLFISASDISMDREGISFTIHNKGKAPVREATLRVWNIEEGILLGDQKVFSIPPDGKKILHIPVSPGPWTLKAKIDPENIIPEVDEENNETTKRIP